MPYIDKRSRDFLKRKCKAINAGELNYILTSEIIKYFDANGRTYAAINDIVGALENCKAEFYRRVVIPYEDKKMDENGDVFLALLDSLLSKTKEELNGRK